MGKKRYAIIGVAGFVAPRHLKAIKETNGLCIAAFDPHDSVGILDSYFPSCDFFTEFGRFERYLEKEKVSGKPIDYLVVCSPNYLHDSHVRFGLRYGCDVICEKPLAINPRNVSAIIEAEKRYDRRVWNILQLRLHPSYGVIRKLIDQHKEIGVVNFNYHAPRGNWYHTSWKGNDEKSGGILMNIGVHFFDLLIQILGPYDYAELKKYDKYNAKGLLIFPKAEVHWNLDIRNKKNMKGHRALTILDQTFDFTGDMWNLHTESYRNILNNKGFPSHSVLPAIELIAQLRTHNENSKSYVSL